MASIYFDDGVGSTGESITMSDDGLPTSRFNNWIPDPIVVGERRAAVGGRIYQFPMATLYQASFEMPRIPQNQENLIQRFKVWAEPGGLFTVYTDDAGDNTYSDCQLAPESRVSIRKDRDTMEWTLSLTIVHMATVPSFLRALYP